MRWFLLSILLLVGCAGPETTVWYVDARIEGTQLRALLTAARAWEEATADDHRFEMLVAPVRPQEAETPHRNAILWITPERAVEIDYEGDGFLGEYRHLWDHSVILLVDQPDPFVTWLVSLHELGHFLGLSHSNTPGSVMCNGFCGQVKISEADRRAWRALD